MWDLCRAASCNSTLQSFGTHHFGVMEQSSTGALIMMCHDILSLKEVTFHDSILAKDAMEFVVERLSNKHITLNKLSLDSVKFEPNNPSCNFSDLQVKHLVLNMEEIDEDFWIPFIDDVAKNPVIEHLYLDSSLLLDEEFESMCDVFLLQNKGPARLSICNVDVRAPMITRALQQNSSVKELSIGDFDMYGLHIFAQGLADMCGLCRLTFGYENESDNYTEEFFKALHQSLELNTTIQTLSLRDVAPDNILFQPYLRKIRYLIALNRVGRNSMMTATVPVGIWAHVLARSSDETDGIYFVLSGKPDILSSIRNRG